MKPERIQIFFLKVPAWCGEPGGDHIPESIWRTYHFCDFLDAVDFVNTVASICVDYQHNPEIEIRGNEVTLRLSTPGGLSELDFELAEMFDRAA